VSTLLSPHERLRLSRVELREQLLEAKEQQSVTGFPRSNTMRLLLGSGRSGAIGVAAGVALLWLLPGARKILSVLPFNTLVRLLFQQRN
jgi:hypothetical protein